MDKKISLYSKINESLISCFADVDGFASVAVRSTKRYLEVIDEFVNLDRRTLTLDGLSSSLKKLADKHSPKYIIGNATSHLVYEKIEVAEWQQTEFDLDKTNFLVQCLLNETKLRFASDLRDIWEKELKNFSPHKAKEGIVSHRLFALFHGICDLKDEEESWAWLRNL